MRRKEVWGGVWREGSEFAVERSDLGVGGSSRVLGGRARRPRVSSSCPSGRDVLIRHLTVAASCAMIDIAFSVFM